MAAALALGALGGCVYSPAGRCDRDSDCAAVERCDAGVCVRAVSPVAGGVDPTSFTTVAWSRLYGTSGATFVPSAIGADPGTGDVVVAGAVNASFDPWTIPTGTFVAKLAAATGARVWATAFPTFSDARFRTAVLAGGDVFFAGTAFDPTTIGTWAFTPPARGALVVGRLDAAGAPRWVRAISNTHLTAALAPVAAAARGADLVVAGTGAGNLGCGDTGGETFAAALDGATGGCLWSHGYGTKTISDAEPRDTGDVAIAGVCTPAGASFDPGGGTTCTKGLFLTVVSANGASVTWAKTTTGAGAVTAVRDLAIAPDGSATVVGDAKGLVDFGSGAVDFGTTERSFAATWGPTGAPVGVARPVEAPYGSDPDAAALSRCAYDRLGKLWVAGRYTGQPTLGGIRFSACRDPGCLFATFLARLEPDRTVSSFLPVRGAAAPDGGAYADDLVLFATTGTVAHALRFTGQASVGGTSWTSVAADLGVVRIAP